MRPSISRAVTGALFGALLGLGLTAALSASAEEARTAFRVCQDPNNLPFSNTKGEGFENKLAELLAAKLGLPVEYYNFPQRMGFIRNTLAFKLPGEDYRCDVVMGVPADYDQAAPTRPYYRSAYALVVGPKLNDVRAPQDLPALAPERRTGLRIGVYDRSPASEWLSRHGLLEQSVPYRILNADPDFYPGEMIERDLAHGKLDAAIVWGPIAGYFAQRLPDAGLRVIRLTSETGLPLEFEIAMGVRHADRAWRATLNRLIEAHQGEIDAILKAYGVPLLPMKEKS